MSKPSRSNRWYGLKDPPTRIGAEVQVRENQSKPSCPSYSSTQREHTFQIVKGINLDFYKADKGIRKEEMREQVTDALSRLNTSEG